MSIAYPVGAKCFPPTSSKRHYAKLINPVFPCLVLASSLFCPLPPQFTAAKGEYEACLSNDRRVEQDAKHVMLDISRLGTKGTPSACDRAPCFIDVRTYIFGAWFTLSCLLRVNGLVVVQRVRYVLPTYR